MKNLIIKLAWFGEKIDKVCRILLGIMLSVLLIVVVAQVVGRATGRTFSWATEFATLLFVVASMLGSAVASRYMLHIGVDTIRDRLKGKAKTVFLLISHLILIVGLVVFVFSSFEYAVGQINHLATTMPSVSLTWFYSSLPICGVVMLYYTLIQFIEIIVYGDAIKIEASLEEADE